MHIDISLMFVIRMPQTMSTPIMCVCTYCGLELGSLDDSPLSNLFVIGLVDSLCYSSNSVTLLRIQLV